jgi:amidophosphoribosyltransferase
MWSRENDTLVRSNHAQPIQDVFAQINDRINEEMALIQNMPMMWLSKENPLFRRIVLGHVQYGTLENSIESVHPFRQNN